MSVIFGEEMPNRYICDVLEDIRACHKTRNYSYLKSLIEEAQMMADRMESSLRDKKDYVYWRNKRKEEKEKYNALVEKSKKLKDKLENGSSNGSKDN